MAKRSIEELRTAVRGALLSHDRLLAAWKGVDDQTRETFASEGVELLKQLFIARIYPVNAFAVLVKANLPAAIELLLRRYLGQGVDPDRKFGGYAFELSSMLYDLHEAHGEAGLQELIQNPRIRQALAANKRAAGAFAEALGVSEQQAREWLLKQQPL